MKEVSIMKSLLNLTLAFSVLAAPALAFAQTSTAPVTRAQVRAELARLEQAGYNPAQGDDANYPDDIQKAEAKVAAEDARMAASMPADPAAMQSVGADMSGSAAAGARAASTGTRVGTSTGAMPGSAAGQACVGPVSYCAIYFGS
jgi:hypothetical protein